MISPGVGARWAIGSVVLMHLIAFDEFGGPSAVFATIIAFAGSNFQALCKTSVKHVQIAYIRHSHRTDFLILFLAVWMDILALLAACGALARTLSATLDAMTGGMARIFILGRNSPANEPWPDVLGVAIVFLVTGMFMLGLENARTFSGLMTSGVVGISSIIALVAWFRGSFAGWTSENLLPTGITGLLGSAALYTFTFPSDMPSIGSSKALVSVAVGFFVFIYHLFTAGCLSTIMQYSVGREFTAVPILSVLEQKDFNRMIPAVACFMVLSCSGALLELFPEMYNLVVKLTTSEWKIIARQIGFESRESGSPTLAVFTGGSLVAMLAFACPLENLIYILAASSLTAGLLRAFYLLYVPFRPKYIQNQVETSLAYRRLDVAPVSRSKSSMWFLKKTFTSVQHSTDELPKAKPLKKSKRNNEIEREWLLLGEPPSPSPSPRTGGTVCLPPHNHLQTDAESFNFPERSQITDIDCVSTKDCGRENEDSHSDSSSTDIDGIVDEYRQKVTVSTAGPKEAPLKLPTASSWQFAVIAVLLITICGIAAAFGALIENTSLFAFGTIGGIVTALLLMALPKYINPPQTVSVVVTTISLMFCTTLLSAALKNSWPALLFWLVSGLTFAIRCDKWCCDCLDISGNGSESGSGSGNVSSVPNNKQLPKQRSALFKPDCPQLTTIRMPRAPNSALITVTSRVPGHR